jgi:1-deoxy-D-xylulose-5-phosphate reductoisomerase
MKRLAVFGSTGSIGGSTLELARRFPERFEVVALTAGRNIELLREQILEFRPRVVVVQQVEDARTVGNWFPGLEVLHGPSGLVQCAAWDAIDIACQGIVGFAALEPTFELVRRGKAVALANKETLVVAGALLREQLRLRGGRCIPVDSEHNALFQLLEGKDRAAIATVVLTASGGPFWRTPGLDLSQVTPQMAVAHPNWKMGPKISVDSATLMNKGLEVVEAHALFDIAPERIEVWIHPQSIIHGAVWFTDGTCQAQLSKPDMKASISHALAYPERLPAAVEKLSLRQMANLEFAEPDTVRFPCLDLPRQALSAGQSSLIALNAGNEIAVQAFLDKQIRFPQIASVLTELLSRHATTPINDVPTIHAVDAQAREKTREIIGEIT